MKSLIGTAFGHYEIRRLIGKGGMGEVYEAYDTNKGRTVALKLLTDRYTNDETFRARFLRESRAAAILQEPHVIPIHDWGEINNVLYIDMRLVQGQTLHEILQKGALEPERATDIIRQVASALDAAHAQLPSKASPATPSTTHPTTTPATAHPDPESSPHPRTLTNRPPLPRTPPPSPAHPEDPTPKTRCASARSDPSPAPSRNALGASSSPSARAQTHPAPDRSHAHRAARATPPAEKSHHRADRAPTRTETPAGPRKTAATAHGR